MAESAPRSPCVISNVLDIVGDRWTLLIVRDLIFHGKHEYKEFLASPEAIATNILSDRLKRLVKAGMVNELSYPSNRSRKLYYLTAKGKALMPILIEMISWGDVYLPELKEMKPLFDRVRKDRKAFAAQIMQSLEKWETENCRGPVKS